MHDQATILVRRTVLWLAVISLGFGCGRAPSIPSHPDEASTGYRSTALPERPDIPAYARSALERQPESVAVLDIAFDATDDTGGLGAVLHQLGLNTRVVGLRRNGEFTDFGGGARLGEWGWDEALSNMTIYHVFALVPRSQTGDLLALYLVDDKQKHVLVAGPGVFVESSDTEGIGAGTQWIPGQRFFLE